MDCCCYFNDNMFTDAVKRSPSLPTKTHVNSGIFSVHYYNINPENEPIDELLTVKPFFSNFRNPVNEMDENYLMIGITGSEDGKNRRRKTDIVLVLDRSGSMGSGLYETDDIFQTETEYIYSQTQKTKMQLTIEAAKEIFQLLDDDEFVGLIAFDNVVEIVEVFKEKKHIDKQRLFEHLDGINDRGGTNMEIGMEKAIQMLLGSPNKERNQRIIFITDDCPNIGMNEKGLRALAERGFVESHGNLGITYVGVGLTFDPNVSDELSKVRGTTIFSVNTSRELKEMLVDHFNYMVSPIATDVSIKLNVSGYTVEAVYGTDDDAHQGNNLVSFRTLTASAVSDRGIRGSIVLLKLRKHQEEASKAECEIEYTPFQSETSERKIAEVDFVHVENLSVKKACILAVFFDLMKEILPAPREHKSSFSEEEKAKLKCLKEYLNAQEDSLKKDLSSQLDTLDRLMLT